MLRAWSAATAAAAAATSSAAIDSVSPEGGGIILHESSETPRTLPMAGRQAPQQEQQHVQQYQPHRQSRSQRSLLSLPVEPVGVLNGTLEGEDVAGSVGTSVADDDDFAYFDVYTSPCLVFASNDELTFAEYQTLAASCNNTFFGRCWHNETQLMDLMAADGGGSSNGGDDSSSGIVAWTIVFDYEVYYPSETVDPIPAVNQLETVVLDHLSEVTGLTQCNATATTNTTLNATTDVTATTKDVQTVTGNGTFARLLQNAGYQTNFSDDDLQRMMALSGDPRDTLDPDYASCMIPVPASKSENANCMPVTGAVRLYLNITGVPSEEQEKLRVSIESGFQRLIRFGMQQGLYVSGDVQYVSFIGTRIEDSLLLPPTGAEYNNDNTTVSDGSPDSQNPVNDVESGNVSTDAASTGNVQGRKAGIIIGSVGAVVSCLLIWSLLAVQRRQRAVAAADDDYSEEAEESHELEGAEEGQKTMLVENDQSLPAGHQEEMQQRTNISPSPTVYLEPLSTIIADTMEDEDENDMDQTNAETLVRVGSVKVFKDDDEGDDENDVYDTDEDNDRGAGYASPWMQRSKGGSNRSHGPYPEEQLFAPRFEDTSSSNGPTQPSSSLPAMTNDWA